MIDVESGEWNNHVELALWADLIVIAPVTANTMAKMVNGECDNLLLATYLSAKCDVYFAPAMDIDMFKHPSTSKNIEKLRSFGNILIPSGFGELASGLVGEGRMAEPEEIINHIQSHLSKNLPLSNMRVLITAGPTYEPIDPVRFIGNRSSGQMGLELALECANKGAKVDLVLGPSCISVKHSNINLHRVETANEMLVSVKSFFKYSNISIFAAAVSDFSPLITEKTKIKKLEKKIVLNLSQTPDILLEMSRIKTKKQFIVGFSLETDNEIKNAKIKLKKKKLDMIILNSLNDKGAGFGFDTNKITIIDKKNTTYNYNLKKKSEVAMDIVSKIIELYV